MEKGSVWLNSCTSKSQSMEFLIRNKIIVNDYDDWSRMDESDGPLDLSSSMRLL